MKKPILFILILFLFVSLVGVVNASQDSAMNNMTLTTMGDGMSGSLSGESAMDKLQISNDDEILTAEKTFTGSSFDELETFLNNDVQAGDIVYLGARTFTSTWQSYQHNVIDVNVNDIVIYGGTANNPTAFSTLNGNGACIFKLLGSNITLNNIHFVNTGHNGDSGSAVNIQNSGCTINDCSFSNCVSLDGGVIYAPSSAYNLNINNCNFSNYEAQKWGNIGAGGAIFLEASGSRITGCNFEHGLAVTGGAIYIDSGEDILIDGCTFIDNKNKDYSEGGAISITGDAGNVTVLDSIFRRNSATNLGGAVYAGRPEFTAENCTFEDNTANHGGALYIYHDDAKVDNCHFAGNNATQNGGAVYAGFDCKIDIEGCDFRDNNAKGGRAIYSNDANLQISDSNFTNKQNFIEKRGIYSLIFSIGTDYSGVIEGNAEESNLKYWDGSAYVDEIKDSVVKSVGQEVTLEIYDSNGNLIDTITGVTDENGEFIYDYSDFPQGKYTYKAYYDDGQSILQKEGTFGVSEEVSGNRFSDIENAIANAEPGQTILLRGVTYVNDIRRNIIIDKPVTIIGTDGTVLDAGDYSRILNINENVDNVGIANITFMNGAAEDGAAIYINSNSDYGVIENSTFIDNTASRGGGSIRNQGGKGWNIYDSTFANNTVTGGTSRDINFGGGAIWSCNSVIDIHNSTFNGNNATYGGALRGAFNIYDSEFDSNTARDGNGGAIDVATDASLAYGLKLEFINSTFTNNDAKGDRNVDQGRAEGGAIHIFEIQEVDLYNCTCINNTADRGGAVDFYKMNVTHVENCTFVNNNATSEGAGLAIFCHNSTFKDSVISNNNAGTDGGAIWIIGNDAKFINVTSENNTASRGGSAYIEGNNILVENSTFNNNKAINNGSEESGLGGALDILGDNCRINNVTADNNTAYRGGAAFIRGDNTSVRNSTFDGNNATLRGGGLNIAGEGCTIVNVNVSNNNVLDSNAPDAGLGGGIYVVADSTIFINVTANNNTAKNGGGAYIDGDDILVQNCTLSNNKAINNGTEDSGLGGGLDIFGNGCQIFNVTADGNTAYRGGGVFIRGNDTAVKDSTFDGNNATVRGGGLNIAGEGCTFENIEVCNNNVLANSTDQNEGLGGGIYLVSNGIVFRNITIDNNTAKNGGGAYIQGDNTVLDNCTLSNNIAYFNENDVNGSGLGGALDIVGNGCTMTNVTSLNNSAYRGGSTFVRGNNTRVEDCKLDGNNATLRGGGLNIAGENCTVTNVEVSNNNAGLMGGGVYILSDGITLKNVTADNNTAERGAGAFIGGDGIHVIDSEFNNNRAIFNESNPESSGLGGGMDIAGNDCYINNTHSNNNTAYRGGSTFIRGNNTVVENCNLDGNNATLRGGGLNIAGENCTVTNVSVSNNNAGLMGGGIYVVSDGTLLTNVTADNNTAERGAGAFIDGDGVHVLDSEFNNNRAIFNESKPDDSGLGGGMDIAGNDCYINNTHSNNNSAYRGGSTFIRGNNTVVENCNLDGNNATLRGGGLNIAGENCTVTNVSVSNNNAGLMGGGIYVVSDGTLLTNITADNNTAERGAGAFIDGDGVHVLDSEFNNNRAIFNESKPDDSGLGGGMDIAGNDCYINNTHSNNNTAYRGGSTFIRGNNTVVENCNLDGNNATLRGGGLNIAGENCTVTNVSVSNNNAGLLGGGIYVVSDGTLLKNITADNNTAQSGGGAFINGTGVHVLDSEFNNNRAIFNESNPESSGLGGGMDIAGNDCYINNTHSNNNSAYRGGSTFIRGNNTVVENCNLDNNTATLRGGGLNIGGDNCNVTNVSVSNNKAGLLGGGIYVVSDGTTFTNVTADNNTAQSGGGAFINGTGVHVLDSEFNNNRAIFNESNPESSGLGGGMDIAGNDCYINNTHSNNNSAYRGGSTFIRGNNTVVENCNLDNNTATLRGGGLNIGGDNCNVTNVSVSNNKAGLMGGGIYVVSDGTTFTNVTADNNTAERGGGAFINGTGVHVLDSEFNNNRAIFNESNPESSGLGGGMDIAGNDCYINNTHSNNNSAYRGGSTFIRGNNTVVENCNLDNNSATLRGGGLNIAGDNCTVNNISVSNNKAGLMGGGLYILSNGTTINGIIADNNTAERGGSAFINGTNVKVQNGELNNNRAIYNESRNDTSGLGGGFDIAGDNILVDNVHSNNNTAYRGGSTFIRGNNVTVTNCNLDNNTAGLRGGGLNVGGDNCTFENLTISNCNATEQGGAVYVIGSNNVFDNVTSVNNTAKNGGSSYIKGDNNTVMNCILDNNNATENGGGLFVEGDNCTFENVDISNCNAYEGGAAFVRGDNAHFDNITSKNNNATHYGGSTAVYGNNVTVENSVLTDNHADNSGGAIFIDGHNCTFSNNNISSNDAPGTGGGIYIVGDGSEFSDNQISNNKANIGGAIGIFGGNNTSFTNNNITFNNATSSGGAIYVEGDEEDDNAYFTNNNISSNHAELNGGGLYCVDVTVELDQIYGYNNTALKGGFADISNGYEVLVENSTFISNHALGDIADGDGIGGGFLITGSHNVDVQADFYNNTATNGSAIYVQDTEGLSVHDSKFYDNQAHSYYLLAAPENGTVYHAGQDVIVKFSHIGGDNIANAIHNFDGASEITIRNITFPFYHNGVVEDRTTPNEDLTPVLGYSNFNGTNIYIDDLEDNQVIYYEIYDNETGQLIRNGSARTDIDGSISIDLSDLGVGVYLIKAWYNETTYYTEISNETIIVVVDSYEPNMTVGKDSLNGSAILYVEDIVAFNITVINTGNRILGNVTVTEIYNSSELEYLNHTDKALWEKSGDVFTYLNDLGIDENATFTIWFRTLTNGTLINNVTARSNITNETNSSANVTVYNKITINFTKVWNDSDDHDGFRPDNVTFVLYADGDEYTRILLNGTGNIWSGNFTDLPTINSNGTAIVYTVDELPVDNYTKSVVNSSLANYTIMNTYVVNFTSVNVTKVWNDSDDHDGFRPDNVTFVLYADGERNDTIVLNESNNWMGSWSNLSIYKDGKAIVYTVVEEAVEHYNSTVTNSTLGNYTITNTHIPYNPNMTVEKITLDKVVFVNDTVKYLIVVTNTGDCVLTDVTVYEIFKSGELDYNDYIDSTGNWIKTGNYVFVYNGTLTAGESANFTVVFTALTNGTILNTVNVSSNETDNKTGNNTTTVFRPNMTVQKVTLDNVVFVNDTVRFLIVITNTGDCDLTNVKATEIFNPKELEYNAYIDSTGKWSKESDYVFVYDGNLTAGESANFTVVFTALTNGTLFNKVYATSNETDNKTGNNTTDVKPICDLEITKSVNPAKVYVNDTVVWTIEVVNHGPSKAENVVVYDTIPDGLEFSVPQGCTFDGKYLIWNVGDLDANQSAALELTTKVTCEGNITNIVVVNSSTPDSNESNNEANNTTVVEPICDLEITKLVNASSVNVNESVEWTIIVVNKGPSTAMDVVVREILPDGLAIISAAPSAGSFDEKSRIWVIGELDTLSSVSLVLVTKVLTNGTLINVVVVNSTTPDYNGSNNQANNTTVANPICDLEVVKLVNASEVNVSDIVEWTITVKNKGPSAACDVVAKDTLPDGVKLVEVPENCRLEGNTVIWTIGILPAYDRISITLLTQVVTEGNKTNIVIVNSTTPDSNESNNRANNTTDVHPICDLQITKLVNATDVYVNDVVEWTVVVKNNGPSAAKDVVVSEFLPDGIILNGASPSIGTYENGIWKVGDMEMDASQTLVLITKVLTEGIKTNIVVANSTTPDSNKSNNKANNTTEVNPICDLEITKIVNATDVNVTDLVEWTITVVNNGPSIARDVVAVDTLPDGVKLVEVPENCRLDGNNVVWTIGDLDADTPVSITLLTQVLSDGIKTNVVIVNSTTPDSNKTNNKANNTTVADPVCDLEIIKLVSSKKAYVGEELTWTIRVTNHGPSAALDVEVLEDIPNSLKLIRYVATEGTYDKTTNIWTIGKLNGDASATLTIVTEVLSVGNITNPVEVTTSTPDSNKTNNKANNTTEASEICDLELKKSSDRKVYYVGDEMHWIIEVVNHGPSPARDVVAYDVLSSSVRFISYTASKGSYDASTGRWDIGELAKGESVTLDILCEVLSEGMITNYANVTTSVNETNLDNNYDNATVEVTNKTEPVPIPEPESEPTPEPPVTLKETGNPIAYLIAAVLAVFGSCWLRKKQE